mmetsp:Transcript_11614/g.32158  ORF Transcript_11614/g.32158 Transcript_11614/m.32158 type:complete len:253 (+) Transcript_11614:294-1052(+)
MGQSHFVRQETRRSTHRMTHVSQNLGLLVHLMIRRRRRGCRRCGCSGSGGNIGLVRRIGTNVGFGVALLVVAVLAFFIVAVITQQQFSLNAHKGVIKDELPQCLGPAPLGRQNKGLQTQHIVAMVHLGQSLAKLGSLFLHTTAVFALTPVFPSRLVDAELVKLDKGSNAFPLRSHRVFVGIEKECLGGDHVHFSKKFNGFRIVPEPFFFVGSQAAGVGKAVNHGWIWVKRDCLFQVKVALFLKLLKCAIVAK